MARGKAGTPLSTVAFPQISIIAAGLCCISGDQPFALLGAVAAPVCGARPAPVSVPVAGENGEARLLSAPVPGFEDVDHPELRIAILLQSALESLLQGLPAGLDASCLQVTLLLPGEATSRGGAINRDLLEQELKEANPVLASRLFRLVSAEEGACHHLSRICRELGEGRWQAAIFGGVDSLVDVVTCTELARAGRIMTTASGEGLVPGEAAACVLLRSSSANEQSAVDISAIGTASEPHVGAADRMRMTGLAAALEQALNRSGMCAEDLGEMIHSRDGGPADALEWYQMQRQFWTPQTPEKSRMSGDLPAELGLSRSLGEIGAAALPVMLVLGCARFAFTHPAVTALAVCETGDEPFRGTVILTAS